MSFFKRDKRRKGEELVNRPFSLMLTNSEFEWVGLQAKKECNSRIGIIRKAIKLYKLQVEPE